jgi:hypothetical protein
MFGISLRNFRLDLPLRKTYQALQEMSINYKPHNNSYVLLLQDYFPAVRKLAQIKILHLYDSGKAMGFYDSSSTIKLLYHQQQGRTI